MNPTICYGAVGTLSLSFNTDDVLAPATDLITATLGIKQGEGLGVFASLSMHAVGAPLTRTLVTTLQTSL